MKNLSYPLAIIIAFILFSASSTAQPFGQRNWEDNNCRRFENLELTTEQKETLETLQYEHRLQAAELHSQLEINRIKMEKLFNEESIDEDELMMLNEENNAIHNKLSEMRVEMRIQMNSLLTAEQKEKINEAQKFNRKQKKFHGNHHKGYCRKF